MSQFSYWWLLEPTIILIAIIQFLVIINIQLASCQTYYVHHHHHPEPSSSMVVPLEPATRPSRFQTLYTITRTGRSAVDMNGGFHETPSPTIIHPHYEYYQTVQTGHSDYTPVIATTPNHHRQHHQVSISPRSYGSTSSASTPTSTGSGSSVATPTAATVGTTTATIIKHPSTCSYDRSQTACTFSLLCYLANGVPIEGCEENPSLTCCYIRLKGSTIPSSTINSLTSKSDGIVGQAHNIVYRPYTSMADSSSLSASHVPITSPVAHSINANYYHQYPLPNHHSITSSNTNKYRNTNMAMVPADSSLSSTKIHSNLDQSQQSSNFESSFNLKNDLLSPYEPQGGNYNSQHEFDYAVNNAIRRTRPDGMKSVFQEIVNRKFYARNYNIEDICGKPMSKPRSRIIGGQDAYFGEFPWQVHIKITKHQCGGALINSRFIVTAAHCIYQAPMHQLNVIIGAHDIEDPRFQDTPPQYFRVSRVILHPNFRFSASHPDRYDIALIKLDSPVRFSDSVLPVCLPEENLHFEGRKGVVTGWGKTDPALSNRYGTRLLQKVDVPIIDNEKCETWHRTRGIDLRIFSEMMCAGYEDGQKDACVGDSGGPLVININGRWTLAGITSAGFGCAQSRQPGIYHRVAHTVEWIRQTLQEQEEQINNNSNQNNININNNNNNNNNGNNLV